MREIKFRAWDGDNMQPWEAVQSWHFNWVDAVTHTFMQYTGLKDKNGKEIYGSDLLKTYYKGEWVVLEVVWNPLGMWSVKWRDGYLNNYPINSTSTEVIGNVHENPDLLTKL